MEFPMQFSNGTSARSRESLKNVSRSVFWLDRSERPPASAKLTGTQKSDFLVVGGGFTGLWTALLAKQEDPERSIILVDGGRLGDGASGRNGGFVSSSLTHGFANGYDRWPQELPQLLALGHANLEAIEKTIADLGIDCDFVRSGELDVAVTEHQALALRESVDRMRSFGEEVEYLNAAQARGRVNSPTYLGAVLDRKGSALIDPARLVWGLRSACIAAGIQIFEQSPVRSLAESGNLMVATTSDGIVHARNVALATNAFPSLLRRVRNYVVPVYDYVLMTEPLTSEQRSLIGWEGREGLSDSGNQFHYYRTTEDGRILWGGYDAIYHRGNGFGPQFDNDEAAYERLAEHFFQTFPQLEGLQFTHAWGGAIDTCTRFSAFWGTAFGGKTAYVAGFTGLGVGASRFGALTMLDLLGKRTTERTRLAMVRKKPLPFPPEPFRSIGIALTTRSLQRADRTGSRNLWLKTLDRFGLGFDS
jgi:glycine/D-amino acid oxidase-like deaminating enzyme